MKVTDSSLLHTGIFKSHIFYISHDLFAEAVLLHFDACLLPQPSVETFSSHLCVFLCSRCVHAHESAQMDTLTILAFRHRRSTQMKQLQRAASTPAVSKFNKCFLSGTRNPDVLSSRQRRRQQKLLSRKEEFSGGRYWGDKLVVALLPGGPSADKQKQSQAFVFI